MTYFGVVDYERISHTVSEQAALEFQAETRFFAYHTSQSLTNHPMTRTLYSSMVQNVVNKGATMGAGLAELIASAKFDKPTSARAKGTMESFRLAQAGSGAHTELKRMFGVAESGDIFVSRLDPMYLECTTETYGEVMRMPMPQPSSTGWHRC